MRSAARSSKNATTREWPTSSVLITRASRLPMSLAPTTTQLCTPCSATSRGTSQGDTQCAPYSTSGVPSAQATSTRSSNTSR